MTDIPPQFLLPIPLQSLAGVNPLGFVSCRGHDLLQGLTVGMTRVMPVSYSGLLSNSITMSTYPVLVIVWYSAILSVVYESVYSGVSGNATDSVSQNRARYCTGVSRVIRTIVKYRVPPFRSGRFNFVLHYVICIQSDTGFRYFQKFLWAEKRSETGVDYSSAR